MVVLHESRRLLLHAVQGLGFSNPLTLYTLGCACLELGLLEEATQHLRRAAEVQLSLMSQPPGVPVQDGTAAHTPILPTVLIYAY